MAKIIFYFSGTGNSYAISKSLAEKLGETVLSPIIYANDFTLEDYHVVGFVFPVYYTHAPKIVLKILDSIKLKKEQQVFLVASFGASWGYALQDARSALEKYNINLQEYKVQMPGNYILEYGGLPAWYQRHILSKMNKSISNIATHIDDNAVTKQIKPNLLARLAKQRAVTQINNFAALGSQFYCLNQCNLCKLCITICPVNNISILENRLVWGNRCEQCMACIQWCPQHTITHPSLRKKRKRYTHPDVSILQLQERN
ncbi:EFR1 family ferrodoxin [Anaerosporobacter sp.]|uniref:EFR1 family ferrodoxin n=1 Tax=Anaerosporobacter sp. TaxID=1872529 RepID=UPI00286F4494|nr:EFR1 family ferrodoxin [Anaerosporobacter sp.]